MWFLHISWQFGVTTLNFLRYTYILIFLLSFLSFLFFFFFFSKNGAQIRARAFTFLCAAPVPIFLHWFIRSSRTFEDQLLRPIGSRYRKLHIPLFKCAHRSLMERRAENHSTLAPAHLITYLPDFHPPSPKNERAKMKKTENY